MLELNTTPPAPAADLISDGSEATFMQDVIEASQIVPVIVDFWATWCGPCKTLGPALEAAVTAAKGAVKMVKMDVDQNQSIASQLRIQSIPTVYAFWKGQPVDGFQGAVAGSEIEDFVTRVAAMGDGATDDDGGLEDALKAAEEMLEEGAFEDAAQTFEAIASEAPENAAAHSGLIRAHIAAGNLEQAEATLNGIDAALSTAPELEAAFTQLELAKQATNLGPLAELQAAVDADENNHQARFDLAVALNAAGQADDAVDALLAIFKLDPEWNEGAAKTQLFTIFDALPANDPTVLRGRRKLSSLIFA